MYSPRILSFALLLPLVSSLGCVSSIRPLSDEKTSMPDLRLLGTWEISDPEKGDEKHILTITRKKDSKTVLHVVGKDGEKKEESDLYLTKVGNDLFISTSNEDNGKQVYVIAKYQLIGDNTLKLWALDNEFLAAAITKKELKGTATKKEFFVDILLDDTPENLRKFIEKNGAKCFSKELEVKVKKVKAAERVAYFDGFNGSAAFSAPEAPAILAFRAWDLKVTLDLAHGARNLGRF